jgi:hypothetical protein
MACCRLCGSLWAEKRDLHPTSGHLMYKMVVSRDVSLRHAGSPSSLRKMRRSAAAAASHRGVPLLGRSSRALTWRLPPLYGELRVWRNTCLQSSLFAEAGCLLKRLRAFCRAIHVCRRCHILPLVQRAPSIWCSWMAGPGRIPQNCTSLLMDFDFTPISFVSYHILEAMSTPQTAATNAYLAQQVPHLEASQGLTDPARILWERTHRRSGLFQVYLCRSGPW